MLAALAPGRFAMTAALTFACELIPPRNNKGTALATLLEDLAVDAASVIAFGDGDNDVSMFGVAGMSVAMGA